MVGMDLVIAMPISWLPLVSDYSRFATDSKSSFWGTWIGYFVVSSWMYLIGLTASLATQSPDPSGVVMNLMLKFGWAIPALIIVSLLHLHHHLLGYLFHSNLGTEYFPETGRTSRNLDRRNPGDHCCNSFPCPSRL